MENVLKDNLYKSRTKPQLRPIEDRKTFWEEVDMVSCLFIWIRSYDKSILSPISVISIGHNIGQVLSTILKIEGFVDKKLLKSE